MMIIMVVISKVVMVAESMIEITSEISLKRFPKKSPPTWKQERPSRKRWRGRFWIWRGF